MAKKLTAAEITAFAQSQGLDLVGFGNIERFATAPRNMHPASIFPECKTVIAVARRILRGNWRGIEEGTYWPTYTYFGYHGLLNSYFIPAGVYETCCFIEDAGWEAVPYYPGVPERQSPKEPYRKGGVPNDVHMAIRIVGMACGLGECGWSKVFLTKKFGPRVRLSCIFTDAEIEPTPLVEPGSLCDRCMECVKGCQACAIPHIKEHKSVKVQIEDKTYEWGDIQLGRCTLGFHGGDAQVSPFMHKSIPGWELDVPKQECSENNAYKMCWTTSLANWSKCPEDATGHVIDGHVQLRDWGGGAGASSFAVGGSRGCMRSCFNHLEKRGKIEQTFENGEFIKRERWILPKKCGGCGPMPEDDEKF